MKSPMIHIENLHIQLPRPHLFGTAAFSGLDAIVAGIKERTSAMPETAPEGAVIDPDTGLMRAIIDGVVLERLSLTLRL